MAGLRMPLGTGLCIFAMAFGTYPRNGYQGLFAGIKLSERDADHSPTYSKSSSNSGLDRPRGFQEVKAPIFRDNGTGWW